jgi:hypothetical protein
MGSRRRPRLHDSEGFGLSSAASVAAAVAVEEEVEVALLAAVLPRKWKTQQA